MPNCTCRLCLRHRHAEAVIASRDADKLIELLNQTMNYLCEVEAEGDLNRLVLNGTWPSAREQLKHAMVLAEKHAAEHPQR